MSGNLLLQALHPHAQKLLRDVHNTRVGELASRLQMSHCGAVIFLHGSGDSGAGVRAWIESVCPQYFATLEERGFTTVFPSAVPRRYTMWGGEVGSVWHDRVALEPSSSEESCEGIADSAKQVNEIISKLVKEGIAASQIFVGGFSQGGGMAIYAAYHSEHAVAGAFGLSSFLADDSIVFKNLAADASLCSRFPVVMCHGDADPVVRYDYGEKTCKKLKAAGVDAQWKGYSQLEHQLQEDELSFLLQWICSVSDNGSLV